MSRQTQQSAGGREYTNVLPHLADTFAACAKLLRFVLVALFFPPSSQTLRECTQTCSVMAVASILGRSLHASVAPVPPVARLSLADIAAGQGAALLAAFSSARNAVIISGAGISTASGIPDYRSPGRPVYKPLQHADFIRLESTRRRYWSRSFVGYERMGHAQPNEAHHAVAQLQSMGHVRSIITQNVDRLHTRAGAKDVIELHGTVHSVECLTCHHTMPRAAVQDVMEKRNAAWLEHFVSFASVRPDGDVDLPDSAYGSFCMPRCPVCGDEMLKPQVVFFGGSLPPPVSKAAMDAVLAADALLIVGSTLSTFSALRLVRAVAAANGGILPAAGLGNTLTGSASRPLVPIGIINFGETRADEFASFKIEEHCSSVLSALVQELQ